MIQSMKCGWTWKSDLWICHQNLHSIWTLRLKKSTRVTIRFFHCYGSGDFEKSSIYRTVKKPSCSGWPSPVSAENSRLFLVPSSSPFGLLSLSAFVCFDILKVPLKVYSFSDFFSLFFSFHILIYLVSVLCLFEVGVGSEVHWVLRALIAHRWWSLKGSASIRPRGTRGTPC